MTMIKTYAPMITQYLDGSQLSEEVLSTYWCDGVLFYLKGLTPECVNMCIFRFDLFLNDLPHFVHLTLGGSPIWVGSPTTDVSVWVSDTASGCASFLWRCAACRVVNTLSHNGHGYSSSAVLSDLPPKWRSSVGKKILVSFRVGGICSTSISTCMSPPQVEF